MDLFVSLPVVTVPSVYLFIYFGINPLRMYLKRYDRE